MPFEGKRTFLIYFTIVHFFALVGFAFVAVFIAMQFGLLNVAGAIADRNAFFESAKREQAAKQSLNQNPALTPAAIIATTSASSSCPVNEPCAWNETSQWQIVSAGLSKDEQVIERVASETGVPARLIASVAVPEQLRFFTAEREVFKRYFEPLKILGTLTQFSLGVTGIKPETAKQIEDYAKDDQDSHFAGASMQAKFNSLNASDDKARLARLTDEKNHYWQYYYTAAFIKEIDAEWRQAGFPLDYDKDSGVFVTLFNIGFKHSKPNNSPQLGGAVITVGGTPYSYGELGDLFYHGEELSQFAK
jgi:hypothetical protein